MSDQVELEEKKKNNGGYIVVIILLLLGLGFMAYLISSKNGELEDCSNANKALQADMNGMNQMLEGYVGEMSNDLKTDFKNMLDTYDQLIAKDASQTDSLNAQKARIQELMDEVDRGKMNAHRLFLAKKEIETLRGIMRGYVQQIDSLNTANYRLTSDLDSTRTVLTSTTAERDQLQETTEQQQQLLEKGAIPRVSFIESTGLKMRLNNTTTETDRARNTVQIRTTLTLAENPLTPKGNLEVFMQIIDPSGKIMQQRSSNILTDRDGKKIPYSDSRVVDYDGKPVDLSVFYSLGNVEASKGEYTVKIYCQGYLIKTNRFSLK